MINEYFNTSELAHSFGYLLAVFCMLAIAKIAFRIANRKIRVVEQLIVKDNVAFSIAYVGYLIGAILVVGGALLGESHGFWQDLILLFSYGIIGIVLLLVSIGLTNKLILTKFDIKKEIFKDRNLGTGFIEATMAIATGLLLFGALIGESESFTEGLITLLVYWGLGMLCLVIVVKAYAKMLNYNIHDEIEKDNVAVGISLSGVILSTGLIIMHALKNPFTDWHITLFDILYYLILTLILLPVLRWITDTILLPGRKLTDEIVNQEHPNSGAALIEFFSYAAAGIFVVWLF